MCRRDVGGVVTDVSKERCAFVLMGRASDSTQRHSRESQTRIATNSLYSRGIHFESVLAEIYRGVHFNPYKFRYCVLRNRC